MTACPPRFCCYCMTPRTTHTHMHHSTMCPPAMRLAAVLAACLLLPLSSSAFAILPTSSYLVTCGPGCRYSAATTAARCYALALSRGDAWCDRRSLQATRTTIVLQAAADGSEQLREEQQSAAKQAAARSKQLNIACNDVVRTILDGNPNNEKERAEALRERLLAQRDDLVSPEDKMSALFFDNLLLVCQHELHPDIGVLRGSYGKAWTTILHYIEDAGWQLTDPPFSISG